MFGMQSQVDDFKYQLSTLTSLLCHYQLPDLKRTGESDEGTATNTTLIYTQH